MAADKFKPHHPAEFDKLLEWTNGSQRILEIGSRYGAFLKAACERNRERIISVDLPGYGPWGNADSEPYLVKVIEDAKAKGIDAHLILGNSRDPEVIERVNELGPYDFIFIDGDHTYEGVKTDWENYGPMGNKVAFHDIIQPKPGENQALQVWKFWQELKEHSYALRDMQEFIGEGSKMGIGVVC